MHVVLLASLTLLSYLSLVKCNEEALGEAIHLPNFSTEADMMKTMGSLDAKLVLVLSYGGGGEKCAAIVEKLNMRPLITELTQYGEEEYGIPGLVAATLADKTFEKKYGLKTCPNLILYRNKIPIVYDGENLHMRFIKDDIGQWVASNMKSEVIHLSTETFEHQTQASTGSTTGDWLIWFHNTSCSELTAIWEAIASRLKYSKVIGEVDTTLNPKLAQRFNLEDCQTVIMFRQGKYYKYTGDNFGVHALANFAEISYKNFNAQVVRPPPSPFDEKVEQLTLWLKESPYGLYILVSITFLLFGGVLYLVCTESRAAADAEKKEN